MIAVKVRAACEDDVPALAVLLARLGYPSEPREVARRLAVADRSPADHLLVAVEGTTVVGLASLNIAPMFAHTLYEKRLPAD